MSDSNSCDICPFTDGVHKLSCPRNGGAPVKVNVRGAPASCAEGHTPKMDSLHPTDPRTYELHYTDGANGTDTPAAVEVGVCARCGALYVP